MKKNELLHFISRHCKSAYALTLKRIMFEISGICRTIFSKNNSLISFRDKYKGQGKRAFVVATGPSLRMDDLEKLHDEITFSVNGVFQLYNKTDWRPTYYGILDKFVYKRFIDNAIDFDFDHIAKEQSFVDLSMKKDLEKNNESFKKVSFVPVYRFNHYIDFESRKFGFTTNLLKGHYSTWTVTNFAINLAAFMGINEIYLLGVDCNYTGNKQYANGVMDPKKMNDDAAYRTQQKMIDSYEFVRSKTEPLGIHVYNATRGGSLEVFERVSFDGLFNETED